MRKRGTSAYMLPGGKRDPGEDDATALARELMEELGCTLTACRLLGAFEAAAANESGATVRSHAYEAEIDGAPAALAEIEDLLWIDPAFPPDVTIAPLLKLHLLPRLAAQPSEMK